VAKRGGVEVAELGDGERLGREREAGVRVRELRPQAVAPGEDDRAVVERDRGQLVDRLPAGVAGESGVEVARHEPEVRGRELPAARVPVGVAPRLELLEVGELPHVHLLREVAPDRGLERLARLEVAAGKGPEAELRLASALPEERAQPSFPHLEHDGERHLRGAGGGGCGRLAARF